MSILDDDLNDDIRADSILAILDEEEAKGATEAQPEAAAEETTAAPAEEAVEPEATESGPEETPVTVTEEGKDDPAEPVIEPPDSWKAEAKERFKSLPRDLQAVIAEREAEQKATFNRQINETATKRREAEAAQKAADERAATVAQEQQRAAQALAAAAQYMENSDPVIAAYRSTDLQRLARENPSGWAELEAAYRVRMDAIEKTKAEQARLSSEAQRAHTAREESALIAKIPEWSAPEVGQAAMTELRSGLSASYGFNPTEIAKIADHRLVLVAKDALEAPKLRARVAELEAENAARLKAAQQALQAKKVPVTGTSKTLKPGPSNETAEKSVSDRSKALINRAGKARSLSEAAELIAQAL